MIDSIQASYIKQSIEQGRPIKSSGNIYYLSSFAWKDTVEGVLFWNILYASYSLYGVYDYTTIIKLYIRFNTVPHVYVYTRYIYRDYFDKKKGTLSGEGFEYLIKKIEKC